jgi:hypothetical protein
MTCALAGRAEHALIARGATRVLSSRDFGTRFSENIQGGRASEVSSRYQRSTNWFQPEKILDRHIAGPNTVVKPT